MYFPLLGEVKELLTKGEYDIVPIAKEIYSDALTPIEVLRVLKHESNHCYLLESSDDSKRQSRYTFLGFNPKNEITCQNGIVRVDGKIIEVNHPKDCIRALLNQYRSPKVTQMPTFTGGLVGYFAYDYFKYSEPTLNLDAKDNDGFNDLDLMLFDQVICFDNFKRKLVLINNIKVANIEDSYLNGIRDLDKLADLIINGVKVVNQPLKITGEFKSLFTKEKYCAMIDKAKKHIKEGDIFQVVLSNRYEVNATGSLLDTYRVLRTTNPSPYMFYFTSNELEIAGASPETLVKLDNQSLFTFPLAGTRARGKDYLEDIKLEKELLNDPKELAEHNMLVDLGRNDLGKVSKFNSVQVEKYLSIERFSHVMHIGSTVKGTLLETKDALDALDAVLPAGTLSGAPKIKAIKIINELEDNKRGIYGGAIGYLDFTGNLDMCIAIRIAYKKNDKVYVRAGAGIVYDSKAQNEYQECLNKAKAVVEAIKTANGGID